MRVMYHMRKFVYRFVHTYYAISKLLKELCYNFSDIDGGFYSLQLVIIDNFMKHLDRRNSAFFFIYTVSNNY